MYCAWKHNVNSNINKQDYNFITEMYQNWKVKQSHSFSLLMVIVVSGSLKMTAETAKNFSIYKGLML